MGFFDYLKRKREEQQVAEESQRFLKAWLQLGDDLANLHIKPHLIMQNGEILWTSEELKQRSHSYYDGRVFEVIFNPPNQMPIFVYYENETYYHMCAYGAGISEFQSKLGCALPDEYRNKASFLLGLFMAMILKFKYIHIDFARTSYTHNRMHTNTIAWVERYQQWYPFRDTGTGDYVTYAIQDINRGRADVADYISIYELSPS